MLKTILKRSISALLSLGVVSVLIFLLSKAVPGDPVETALGYDIESETVFDYDKEYANKKKALSLNLPLFYFSVVPSNFPRNLNGEGTLTQIKERRIALMEEGNVFIPRFYWHGSKNQYHSWIFDKNVSLQDGKPVGSKIRRSIVWTIILVFFSLIFSYGIGILLGLILSLMKSKRLRLFIETTLYGIYAVPVFWLATLLLVFFTTREYGSWTNIFPSVGLAPIDFGEPWFIRIWKFGSQLILPCFVLVLHNLAFLSIIVKRNIDMNKKLAFVETSKAYGFSERETILTEVLPMSLFPLITAISSAVPTAIGGSLIIEIIFNIPGMGRLLYNSILSYDWPVVFPIVITIAIITYFSFLIADILYRIADPRIR